MDLRVEDKKPDTKFMNFKSVVVFRKKIIGWFFQKLFCLEAGMKLIVLKQWTGVLNKVKY